MLLNHEKINGSGFAEVILLFALYAMQYCITVANRGLKMTQLSLKSRDNPT